jgi:hypothetical protein
MVAENVDPEDDGIAASIAILGIGAGLGGIV